VPGSPDRGDLAGAGAGRAQSALPPPYGRAIAGLFVALSDAGPEVGLTLTSWQRDEEDWVHYSQAGRIRPDAYAEVQLPVDGETGVAGAFIEVDFATMDQARLRAKVARHRRYVAETIWWDRHPCCPALLLVTTSEARVNRFLAAVEKDCPRPPPPTSQLHTRLRQRRRTGHSVVRVPKHHVTAVVGPGERPARQPARSAVVSMTVLELCVDRDESSSRNHGNPNTATEVRSSTAGALLVVAVKQPRGWRGSCLHWWIYTGTLRGVVPGSSRRCVYWGMAVVAAVSRARPVMMSRSCRWCQTPQW
jgi:hypothetical protein